MVAVVSWAKRCYVGKKIGSFSVKKIFLLGLGWLMLSASSTVNGDSFLSHTTYGELTVNGNLTFENVYVKGSLCVNGAMRGHGLKCAQLRCNGEADVERFCAQDVEGNGSFKAKHGRVTGKTRLSGSVEITQSVLEDLEISSSRAVIGDSKIRGTVFVKHRSQGEPVLELQGKCVIFGNVVFDRPGKVRIGELSCIKGRIINGKCLRE